MQSIDSTSLHARRELLAGRLPPRPIAFVATEQTGGIGQHGRPWSSPRGGLWLTLTWPLLSPARTPPPTTIAIALGVAACNAINGQLDLAGATDRAQLKWPNDLMLADRKVGGILLELVPHEGYTVLFVGIGINVSVVPSDLKPGAQVTAGSLNSVLPPNAHPIELAPLQAEVIRALTRTLHSPPADQRTVPAARALQWGLGRVVNVSLPDGSKVAGKIRGISDSGELLAEIDGQLRAIPSAGQLG